MENTNIAGAAVNIQQSRVQSQMSLSALKDSLGNQQDISDAIASSVEPVGEVMDSGQAVQQSGRIFEQYA